MGIKYIGLNIFSDELFDNSVSSLVSPTNFKNVNLVPAVFTEHHDTKCQEFIACSETPTYKQITSHTEVQL